MIPPVNAFAALVGRTLVIETVSPTERAAKVNALVVIFKMQIMDSWNDKEIEVAWMAATTLHPSVTLTGVRITALSEG